MLVKFNLTFIIFLGFLNSFFSTTLEPREFKKSKLIFKTNESLTLEINGDSVDFFMIADHGGISTPPYVTPIQTYVSKLMTKLAREYNTQFQFAMGDNFYDDGVQSVDDPRFIQTFENVYNDTNLVNTPWFFSLGNHDYRGEVTGNPFAQIDYTNKSKRWIFPSFLYDLDIVLNSELLIKSIIIDTQLICDEGTEKERDAYLKRVIEKNKEHSNTDAYYYIVLGHYPLWSIGELGPNECMIEKLRSIFHEYKIDGYLSGHEHAVQHFKDDFMNHSIDYLVAGTAAFVSDTPLNRDKINSSMIKFFWETHQNQSDLCVDCSGAIVLGKADKNQMSLRVIDTNENETYRVGISSRRK